MLSQGNLGIHTKELDVATIKLSGAKAVETLVVELTKSLSPCRVFPYPLVECSLDLLLLTLCDCGFLFVEDLFLVSVLVMFAEGGSSKCVERIVGKKPGGGEWRDDVSAASFRLELNWSISEHMALFVYAEQYMVVGSDMREANGANTYRCAHNDWTHGGFGARFKF